MTVVLLLQSTNYLEQKLEKFDNSSDQIQLPQFQLGDYRGDGPHTAAIYVLDIPTGISSFSC
jgi:hypothetical protein